MALVSALAFGTSGSFAKALLDAGWSPGAAVTIRIGLAGLVLAVPSALALRGRWSTLRRAAPTVGVYGLLAVAGCQLFYFNAVRTLSVGVALLLEYLGLVLVVGWVWLVERRPPGRWTLVGAVASIAGLVLVLDVFGDVQVDAGGVAWGLAAAIGIAAFFIISARDDHGVPPIAMAGGGMLVGAAVLGIAGAVGIMPLAWTTDDVDLGGSRFAWWVPVLGLAVVAGALSYATGIVAARALGSKLAAFVGLTEVLFAILVAWLLLDELPRPVQLAGGLLILAGVAAVRYESTGEAMAEAAPEPLPPLDAGDPAARDGGDPSDRGAAGLGAGGAGDDVQRDR